MTPIYLQSFCFWVIGYNFALLLPLLIRLTHFSCRCACSNPDFCSVPVIRDPHTAHHRPARTIRFWHSLRGSPERYAGTSCPLPPFRGLPDRIKTFLLIAPYSFPKMSRRFRSSLPPLFLSQVRSHGEALETPRSWRRCRLPEWR